MIKKIVKYFFLILIVLTVNFIYFFCRTDKLNYIALGDSVAEGMSPYGEIGYSYTDFLANDLKNKGRLSNYNKKYAKSGYVTDDIINDIRINNQLKRDLRESDLVTISIGANDFLHSIDIKNIDVNNILNLREDIDKILPNIDMCINEVRKYAKEKILIVGYYNPIPFLFNTSGNQLDILFAYIDSEYQEIANKYNCTYISLYQLFKNHSDYLPNPNDIHPNLNGYKAISDLLLSELDS